MRLRNISSLTASLLSALLLSACMSTPEAPDTPTGPTVKHDPATGGTFSTEMGTFEIVNVEGRNVRLKEKSGTYTVTMVGGLFPLPDMNDDDAEIAVEIPNDEPFSGLWPLQVGKQASLTVINRTKEDDEKSYTKDYSDVSSATTWRLDAEVIARQEVDTAAGTFDSYLIRFNVQMNGKADMTVSNIWYAPKLGLPVKRDQETVMGTRFHERDFELQSYKLPET